MFWQVVGLPLFLYVGSPSSKKNDDRMESKIDALLPMQGGEKADLLVDRLDEHHARTKGHSQPHGYEAEWIRKGPFRSILSAGRRLLLRY